MTTIRQTRAGAVRRPARPVAPRTAKDERSLTHPRRTGLLLVIPAVAFVVVFSLAPLVVAIVISFTNFPLIGSYRFIGLENYIGAFTDPTFGQSILYTLIYTAIVTVPILAVGYALAVLVRRQRRGTTFLRTVLFIPYVVGLTTLTPSSTSPRRWTARPGGSRSCGSRCRWCGAPSRSASSSR